MQGRLKMKVAFHTLGCKVNQYETEAMKEQFVASGYDVVEEEDFADIYIINTCTVTNLADRKSRQYIRRMKKQSPNSVIAVTGCYSQIKPEELEAMPEVNIVTGTGEKNKLILYVEEYLKERENSCHIIDYNRLTTYQDQGIITSMDSRTRAFIKIQEGCDRFCSYCLIPFARGHVRSRNPEEVLAEVEELIKKGFKEIVLTGINTALYGTEKGFNYPHTEEEDNIHGIEVIIKRINELPGDFRIRLSSLEPTVVNSDYVMRLVKYERLCHHLHLSAQSGSDRIIKAMNRKYSRQDYLDIVNNLRKFDPFYGITTDLICGFPGETEEDFNESLKLIREAEFSKVHAFKYSKRQGTVAAGMDEQISGEEKNKRISALISAGDKAADSFYEKCRGDERVVLVEEIDPKTGMASGYTDNYIKVYLDSFKHEDEKSILNCFIKVKLLQKYKDGMKGEI